jgi:hypothetical protein
MEHNPILLLDVDGPLNPYAAKATQRPEGYETHRMRPSGFLMQNALRVWLNPLHGEKLLNLGYDLVWATMWEDEANEWIAPHIGLPELPFISFKGASWFGNGDLYVKTKTIAQTMNEEYAGVPFIWIDDETTAADTNYLRNNCPVRSKIFTINPRIGLLDRDFDEIKAYKAKLMRWSS